jgi:Tol biopolymer transport system component
VSYPDGKAQRFTNDLSYYEPNFDMTRDASMLAAVDTRQISGLSIVPAGDAAQMQQVTPGDSSLVDVIGLPDGRMLARSTSGDLYTVTPDGQRSIFLADARNSHFMEVCGNKYVLFESTRGGTSDAWRVDLDGSNLKQVTHGGVLGAACSGDGSTIYYGDAVRQAVFRMPGDVGAPVKIAEGINASVANVTRDGKLIAYGYQEVGPSPMRWIVIARTDNGETIKRIPSPIGADHLHFTADDKRFEYLLTRNGATNVVEQAIDSDQARPITNFKSGLIFGYDHTADGRLLLARGELNSNVILMTNFR